MFFRTHIVHTAYIFCIQLFFVSNCFTFLYSSFQFFLHSLNLRLKLFYIQILFVSNCFTFSYSSFQIRMIKISFHFTSLFVVYLCWSSLLTSFDPVSKKNTLLSWNRLATDSFYFGALNSFLISSLACRNITETKQRVWAEAVSNVLSSADRVICQKSGFG